MELSLLLMQEIITIYGKDPYHDTLGDRFIYVLAQAHQKTGLEKITIPDITIIARIP